ncbi:hypothetical protein M9H77_36440 [Catharanthus roseus]|uniref:Uncharacterized protein n=1 Tax=Catharanthus roseus TaxID=4058 RepID=A0ACB9ZS71_CATRO|nr:hypothetical protein M9H77_36440 [Catharanthus roseus]
MENGYQFYFLNALGTLLEKKQSIEFNSISCAIPRVDEYHFNIANYASCVLGVEDKGRSMEKELGTIPEELPISLSLNLSLMWHEVSFVELELFLESYLSHVSIMGVICIISFGGGLFLVVSSTSKSVSYCEPLKNNLVKNNVSDEPSCFDYELVHGDPLFDDKVVGFLEFNWASFVIFHESFKEKYVKNCDPILSFFETFMNDFDGAISLNLSLLFLSNQGKFLCHRQKLANVTTSLDTSLENTFGFQFYHLHFKELLLEDFENQIGDNLEFFKVNLLAFEKSNLRKEAFEQACNDFVVGHLYYHRPFKEWFLKLFMSFDSFPKNFWH